jgi:hypothetical protein
MVRPLRFQYPGAVYHVMTRGDGGKVVFETDYDRLVLLKRLEETCGMGCLLLCHRCPRFIPLHFQ